MDERESNLQRLLLGVFLSVEAKKNKKKVGPNRTTVKTKIESVTKFNYLLKDAYSAAINRSATELWTQAVVGLLTEGSVNPWHT